MGVQICAELIYELLAATDPEYTLGLSLRYNLFCPGDTCIELPTFDPSFCYTVGFHHPNFHPLQHDSPGIWNIQSVDLAIWAKHYSSNRRLLPTMTATPKVGRVATLPDQQMLTLATLQECLILDSL